MAVSFYEQVYAVVRQIPPGRVSSYGRIAAMLWAPRAARAVGYALRNLRFRQQDPDYADVPWHRVVNRDGVIRVGTPGDDEPLQVELLREEGVTVEPPAYRVDMATHLWHGLTPLEVGDLLTELEDEGRDPNEEKR